MKLLHFLKSRLVIIVLAITVNITGIDVHSSSSNLPIGKSTITQSQLQIQLVHTLTGHKKVTFGVRAVAISSSGQTLISGGRDDTIPTLPTNQQAVCAFSKSRVSIQLPLREANPSLSSVSISPTASGN
ncbi:hypothetical protein [Nostoc sp.]|uniref:hypothetical protein n=1 Tax=Nostoc sp. TaxID=1180 RepID=UPI003FA5E1ED